MIPSDLSDFNLYGGRYRYVNLVWFRDYADWMTSHEYGLAEMNTKKNHSVAFKLQLAEAKAT